ncbi:SpoIIE family protein phosphatase [bacterium]|nr:SpoIIE family protein phosphatase [bacterium]
MNPSDTNQKIALLEKENERLHRAVEELSILNEIATAISSTLSLNQIVNLIVRKCVKYLKGEQVAVMLIDEEKENQLLKTMVRGADTSAERLPYRFDSQLTGWMLKYRTVLVVNNFANDDRFLKDAKETFPIHSILCVPLMLKNSMIGLIAVFNKKTPEGFSSEDQRLLSIIAGQSTQVIENARLYEEEQQLIRMQEEFRLASKIQLGLLPKSAPKMKGYDIAGVSYPAQIVGGDYFDFIQMDKTNLALCLGDISGKGLPAALLMANLQATIRGQTLLKPLPKDCLQRANKLLYDSTDPQKFATLFYGILNRDTHEMCFANAGHNRPLHFSAKGDHQFLKEAGMALSFVEKTDYKEGRLAFQKGDLLLIYSDGITEAMNEHEEEFGEDNLITAVKENLKTSSNQLIEKMITAVKQHTGKRPQTDDITLIVLKRESA